MASAASITAHAAAIVADQAERRARWDAGFRNVGEGYDLAEARWVAPKLETAADVEQRIRLRLAEAKAFRKTPRGRFLTCIDQLEEVGALEEADRLRGFYNRSITTLNGPVPDQAAIGECLLILNGIGTRTARDGIDALGELLVGEAQRRAA